MSLSRALVLVLSLPFLAGDAVAATVDLSPNFSGEIMDDGSGGEVLLSDEFSFDPPIQLDQFQSLSLKTLFETFRIRISDTMTGDNLESVHIEIGGVMQEYEYIFYVYDEAEGRKEVDRDMVDEGAVVTSSSVVNQVAFKPNNMLFGTGGDDSVLDGMEVVILNRSAFTMEIESLRIGVDGDSITPSEIPGSGDVPLPPTLLLLMSLAAPRACLRMRSRRANSGSWGVSGNRPEALPAPWCLQLQASARGGAEAA